MNQEKEIQTRVNFKLDEILTAIENGCRRNWHHCAHTGHPSYQYKLEALREVQGIIKKEKEMLVPSVDMYDDKLRKSRDKAVGAIMDRFCQRGDRDYYHKGRMVASIIEKLQYEVQA